MSAQRPVPPARSARALIAALLLGIAIGAAAAMLIEQGRGARRTLARSTSPDNSRVAFVAEKRCGDAVCQTFHIGTTDATAAEVRTIQSPIPVEVVWTPDGKRVGFLADAAELVLFDAQSLKEIGIVRLMSAEAAQTRLARGVTFSENGRAVTFDDCPRGRSGCKGGVVGVPQ
jgi:hypothetical protein